LLAAFRLACRADDNLSPLGKAPDWAALDRYQETITHDDFARLINEVYCTHGVGTDAIVIDPESARILENRDARKYFTLRFAKSEADRRPLARAWMMGTSLPPQKPDNPLSDLRVSLDPGHLGGEWAKMEERWFQVGDKPPVQEGDMTLHVAQLLSERLQKLGAKVSLVRDKNEPTTPHRPGDFKQIATDILHKSGVAKPAEDFKGPADPEKEHSIRWQSEILFYRNAEIRRRADIVNRRLRPDIVVALHFNAEAWGDPKNPTLTDSNHLHVLVNGSYLESELELDDVRFEMVERLLSRVYDEELPLADAVAGTMAKITRLPPYAYKTPTVTKVGKSGYLYARNLLANRLYKCPVVYLEPYVMNSREGFDRIQAGDYDGMRNINGVDRPSIFREYADSVVQGLLDYYKPLRH
jgi:N-acetylmuramoyl-L-alanine amidase